MPETPRRVLYLYMLTSKKPGAQVVTYIGCGSDVMARLDMLNGGGGAGDADPPAPAATAASSNLDRRLRVSAGHWRAVLVLVVPPQLGLSARALAEQWKSKSRKIHCRFVYGVSIARTYGLPIMIDGAELKTDPRIYDKAKSLVDELAAAATDDGAAVRATANAVLERRRPEGPPPTFDGLSFARSDGPRLRYKRRGKGTGGGVRKRSSAAGNQRKTKRVSLPALSLLLSQSLK